MMAAVFSAERRWGAVCSCAVLFFASSAAAQAALSEGEVRVSVTAVSIADPSIVAHEITAVQIGIRRGIQENQRLDYTDVTDLLASPSFPAELPDALDELDSIADALREVGAVDQEPRLREILALLEANLSAVRRGQLSDAYCLAAIASCRGGRRQACRDGFVRVLTFREDFVYDLERYPAEFEPVFAQAQGERTADASRGSIEILTQPDGAEVFVDGRSCGASPAIVEGLLVGDHYVTVRAVGYEKAIRRVSVNARYQDSVSIDLVQGERALFLEQDLPGVRAELGAPRAGRRVAGLGAYLPVNQVVIGVLLPSTDGQLDLALFLYDLRTQFLLAQRQGVLPTADGAALVAQQLAAELYAGVDLTGAVAPPPEAVHHDERPSLLSRWWFWTAVGVVAASGVVAGVVLSAEPEIPDGWTRYSGAIR